MVHCVSASRGGEPSSMEEHEELQCPLLSGSPQHGGGGLFRGVLPWVEEQNKEKEQEKQRDREREKTTLPTLLPPLSWRSNCPPQELLDPCALPSALQPFYPPPMLWGDPHTLGLHRKEYLETAFVDVPPPPSPLGHGLLLRGGGSVAGTSGADVVSVSCSLEDEDDLLPDYEDSSSECLSDSDSESSFSLLIPQDHLGLAVFSMLCCFWPLGIAAFYLSQKTNRASAQGDFGGASAASRQALWLAALSILFGVVTYACAIAALISYLSGKPP